MSVTARLTVVVLLFVLSMSMVIMCIMVRLSIWISIYASAAVDQIYRSTQMQENNQRCYVVDRV